MPRGGSHRKNGSFDAKQRSQYRGAKTLQDAADFEEFQQRILPAIRKDLNNGMPAKAILEKYKAIAAARLVTTAATEVDSGKATAAAKEVLDRTEGKAKESKHITHVMGEMSDNELDAVIISLKKETASDE